MGSISPSQSTALSPPTIDFKRTISSGSVIQGGGGGTMDSQQNQPNPLTTQQQQQGQQQNQISQSSQKQRISLATVERSVAAKIYFEQYFDRLYKTGPVGRSKRRQQLEMELESMGISETEKQNIRTQWLISESDHIRKLREKIKPEDFEVIKTIGHGAFGIVRLVREKATGDLYAMKILRKADMIRKNQESHVRAERDLLSDAADIAHWIVRLVYSFDNEDYLYFVMEYMAGGDLLSLLIKMDIFDEDFAKFYVAEMVLSIEEAHQMG